MKTEHRTLIAVGLSVVFFIVWYVFINPQEDKAPAQVKSETVETGTAAETAKATPAKAEAKAAAAPKTNDPQGALPIKSWTISNDLIEAELSTDGAVPTAWKIKKYHVTTDKKSPLIDLAANDENIVPAMALSFENADFDFPEKPRYELKSVDDTHAAFKWRSKEVEVVKTITFDPENYLAEVTVTLKNLSGRTLKGRPVLSWGGKNLPSKGGGLLGFMKQPPVLSNTPVYYMDGKAEREKSLNKIGTKSEMTGSVLWSGLESRYFLSTVIPRVQGNGVSAEFGVRALPETAPGTMALWAGAALPTAIIPSGDTTTAVFSVYSGPKDINKLKAVGVHLDDAIDYGWFTVISVPILYLLHFFHKIIHNYGIAIILMTIFVKLLLHPINVKSLKSMKAMQQVQPQLKELQKKFKDDKQRLNQETMALFKAHKVNPMGGCIPMLAQFPIYIALYKVLWNSIELFHAPFFWFYKDLSAPDPYYITPVLLGLFMVAQQKLMPSTSADPAQKKMMMIMPVMFSVFMLFLPVGLVIYILVNTVMSVTQQYLYNKGIRMRDLIRGKWQPSSI